jgi:hypothetical protein
MTAEEYLEGENLTIADMYSGYSIPYAHLVRMLNEFANHKAGDSVLMPKTLTAENGSKGLMIGEFHVTVDMYSEDEDGYVDQDIPIPWTTIKDMYKKLVEFHAPQTTSETKIADTPKDYMTSPEGMNKCYWMQVELAGTQVDIESIESAMTAYAKHYHKQLS